MMIKKVEEEEVAIILCRVQILQTQEKQLTKLFFENRKVTDFYAPSLLWFRSFILCPAAVVITPNASGRCYNPPPPRLIHSQLMHHAQSPVSA
jgi:hypothetical protein